MATAFVVIVALAVLAAARERHLGRDPAPALRLLAIASLSFAASHCST